MTPSLHRVETIGSTQDLIHELAAAGAPHGTAVVAAEQAGGRGSRGREWHSPRGGLWLSLLWREEGASAPGLLSLRVGIAAALTLEAFLSPRSVRLKWPNDLMVGPRKLGGILCEARWQGEALGWVAVGIGINVRNPLPAAVQPRATSLELERAGVGPEELVEPLVARLRALPPAGDRLSREELAAFRERDWLAGRSLSSPLEGIADGLEPDGRLRVRAPDGAVALAREGSVVLAGPLLHR